MPPRIALARSIRASQPLSQWSRTPSQPTLLCFRPASRRTITANEKPLPEADSTGPGPNQTQLPHVSEEAATTGKITGKGGPDLDQGTPITEVLQRDDDALDKAPQVLRDDIKSGSPKGSRAYSTSTRRQQEAVISFEDDEIETTGHKFGLPELPLPSTFNMKHRYDPVVVQVTNLLMRDGKLSVAQRNMAMILNYLRTAPPPVVNPSRPLMPGAPPPSHLPLNPILYVTLAIDSVAPLLRIRSQKGAAGGGVALQIPVPLGVRQRRRQAIMWILDAASKRRWTGSGKGGFAQKVGQELVSIVEGKSGLWERRGGIHRLAVGARSNLNTGRRR